MLGLGWYTALMLRPLDQPPRRGHPLTRAFATCPIIMGNKRFKRPGNVHVSHHNPFSAWGIHPPRGTPDERICLTEVGDPPSGFGQSRERLDVQLETRRRMVAKNSNTWHPRLDLIRVSVPGFI